VDGSDVSFNASKYAVDLAKTNRSCLEIQ